MEIGGEMPELYAETYGEGMPMLALHGWGVDQGIMKGCLEPVFATAGPRVRRHYVDLPGMGRTPGEDWISGSDDMLATVEGYIDRHFPDEPFILAGESYGGYLSRGLVRKRKGLVRGLLLICPGFRPWVKTDMGMYRGNIPDRAVIEIDAGFMATLSEEDRTAFEGMAVRQTQDAWRLYARDILPGIRAADQVFLETKLSRGVPFREDPDIIGKPFMGPTLIVTGRQDSSAGYKDIFTVLDNYPRATFAVLDRGGHNVQIEQVPVFEALAREWLERIALEELRRARETEIPVSSP